MMESTKKAVYYCSSSFDIDPEYNAVAREVVRAAASKGYGAVSGGSFRGTMGVIADTARECGVENVGVVPNFMKGLEHQGLTKLIWTETMAERKEAMREGTCLAVALPGGIGTLDELMETLTLRKLGRYSGKVIAVNCKGFYNPLKDMLDHFVATGMLTEEDKALISFPETVEEFIKLI